MPLYTYNNTNQRQYALNMLNVFCTHRREDSVASLERATKYNPMYESDITTGYSHYYQRYPEPLIYSTASVEASTDFSSEEIQHIYQNNELTKEVCYMHREQG